jgi:hypothetical protein
MTEDTDSWSPQLPGSLRRITQRGSQRQEVFFGKGSASRGEIELSR